MKDDTYERQPVHALFFVTLDRCLGTLILCENANLILIIFNSATLIYLAHESFASVGTCHCLMYKVAYCKYIAQLAMIID